MWGSQGSGPRREDRRAPDGFLVPQALHKGPEAAPAGRALRAPYGGLLSGAQREGRTGSLVRE